MHVIVMDIDIVGVLVFRWVCGVIGASIQTNDSHHSFVGSIMYTTTQQVQLLRRNLKEIQNIRRDLAYRCVHNKRKSADVFDDD